jgi:hypothetical protein
VVNIDNGFGAGALAAGLPATARRAGDPAAAAAHEDGRR